MSEVDEFQNSFQFPVVPRAWMDIELSRLIRDADSRAHTAMKQNAPIRRVNGVLPDVFGNVTLPAGEITATQLQTALVKVFKAGENIRLVTDPVSGKITIEGHNTGSVWDVNGMCGHVTLTKESFGLDRVDNTADIEKPLSNPVRQWVMGLYNDLKAYIDAAVATINVRITNVDNALRALIESTRVTLQSQINTLQSSKANVTHSHQAIEIIGLETMVRAIVNNRWGGWVNVQLINGWTGSLQACTDGQMVRFRGTIYWGSSLTFAVMPFGFPVAGKTQGLGTHNVLDVVQRTDGLGTIVAKQKVVSRVECNGGALSVNGYGIREDGHELWPCILIIS